MRRVASGTAYAPPGRANLARRSSLASGSPRAPSALACVGFMAALRGAPRKRYPRLRARALPERAPRARGALPAARRGGPRNRRLRRTLPQGGDGRGRRRAGLRRRRPGARRAFLRVPRTPRVPAEQPDPDERGDTAGPALRLLRAADRGLAREHL